MNIKASQVKELRERTGAGMMECKQALVRAQGDLEKAIEDLRKHGLAKADKKSGRIAAEGEIFLALSDDGKSAAMIEMNCETDFVTREDSFQNMANTVVSLALQNKINDAQALMELQVDGQPIEYLRKELVAKIGENISLRRVTFMSNEAGFIGSYLHGGRIGVIVNVKGGDAELAKDLAMHIAASNPEVIHREDYPENLLSKEKEIYAASLQDSGKPPEIVEKIIAGKVSKFLDQVSLLGQPFVKDSDVKVETVLSTANAKVLSFVRYEVGEGIDKETSDFASEVMSQVREGTSK